MRALDLSNLPLVGLQIPGILALPVGAPWPVVLTLGTAGLVAATALALVRECHRHAESQRRETNLHAEAWQALQSGRADVDVTSVIAVLRGRPDKADGTATASNTPVTSPGSGQ